MRRPSTRAQAYLVVAVIVGTGLFVQTVRQLWSGDVWQHAASIRAFEAHPLAPNHPLSVGLIDDPYFLNPWAMAWGTFSRLTGLDTFTTLVAAGLVNMVLLGVGLYRLTTRVSTSRWAPALALLAVLLLWGPLPWRWSGYPNLNSIGFGLPYPSFLALALYLFGLTIVLDLGRGAEESRPSSRRHLAALAGCVVVSVLCHPLTGAALILTAFAIAAAQRDRRLITTMFLLIAVSGALTLLWPFGHLWDLAGAPSAFNQINRSVNRNLLRSTGYALVVAPWVLARLKRPAAGPLHAMFAVNIAAASIGFLGGPSSAGRFLPFALLAVHLAFAATIADAVDRPHPSVIVPIAAALLLVGGFIGVRSALPRLVPSQLLPADLASDERLESASSRASVAPSVPLTDPVAIATGVDGRLLVANGIRLVSPPYPVATLSTEELARRSDDSKRFLTASRDDQRSIAARYGVDVLVVPADTASARAIGPLVASSSVMWVIDVSSLLEP